MRKISVMASAAPGIVSLREVQQTAQQAESLGFSTIVFQDHLVQQHAPLPLLAVVAAATERIRICPYVLNVDWRHPAVVAQDLGTLDVLSSGRLTIGVGAGWNRREYDAVGIPFDPAGTRVDRMQEMIDVFRGFFGDGPFSYQGKSYTVTDHDGYPKPVQKPHPPFLIGGGGKRILRLAAREADIVGFAPRLPPNRPGGLTFDPASITLAGTAEKVSWVREAAGERFEQLELSTHSSGWPVTVTNNAFPKAQEIASDIRSRTGAELTRDDILESPHVWIGTEQQLADKCMRLRDELGISSFMLGHPHEAAGIVERIAGR